MVNIYRLALQVQDASNPSGVVNSFANEILPGIREEQGYKERGTQYIATHPAYILFLDKLVSLGHFGWINDMNGAISDAYRICHEMVEAEDRAIADAPEQGRVISVDSERAIRDRILAARQAQRQDGVPLEQQATSVEDLPF